MNYKLIESNGAHRVVMLETEDLDYARLKYTETVNACRNGTYDFYCAFADLQEALAIVLEDENKVVVFSEIFH